MAKSLGSALMFITMTTVVATIVSGCATGLSAQKPAPISSPALVQPSPQNAQPVLVPAPVSVPVPALSWTDAASMGVRGRGWPAASFATPYDRLPASAQTKVREPLWKLSLDTAGLFVEFKTSATSLHADWRLRGDRFWMHHMPASGVSGLDLYIQTAGGWRWLATGIPKDPKRNMVELVTGLAPGVKHFRLYMPLYNGIESILIGVPHGQSLDGVGASRQASERVVTYGTSIVQGAVASRPGMAYAAQLGRLLDREVINLGFSGNCQMEPELIDLVAQIDAATYVIDCLPNMAPNIIEARTVQLVKHLLVKRPESRILLVDQYPYSDAHSRAARADLVSAKNAALQRAIALLKAEFGQTFEEGSQQRVRFVSLADLGAALQGDDSVDGIHPNDLGMSALAKRVAEALKN
jgi:lysophospholipase L1-like esterase